MNIAEQIKSFHSRRIDCCNFAIECDERSVEILQDFENETTTYTFEDKSELVWSGSSVTTTTLYQHPHTLEIGTLEYWFNSLNGQEADEYGNGWEIEDLIEVEA